MNESNQQTMIYTLVELFHDQQTGAISFNDYIDRLLTWIGDDPADRVVRLELAESRIARIEALCENHEGVFGDAFVDTDEIRAILAGGDV